jgi:DNA (cytosine-5)-methyltransferase 3A
MIKLLIGGSPCTHWSIAQKNGRETEPNGLGWELFKNYLIAKEKFKPDFFLYENNKSAAQPIKDQISKELGVDLMYINSALVSAQNRQRFYAFNWEVEQPEDRGILLRDILESGDSFGALDERAYALTASYWKGDAPDRVLRKHQRTMVAEPIFVGEVPGHKGTYRNGKQASQQYRVFDVNGKSYAVTTCAITNVAEPLRIGTIENDANNKKHDSKQYRVYSPDGKSTTLCGQGGGVGAKTGLYACPVLSEREVDYMFRKEGRTDYGYIQNTNRDKAQFITANIHKGVPYNCLFEEVDGSPYITDANGKKVIVYEVRDGYITVKGKRYPIKLADGYYIIRKLTVKECCRLQTLPDDYCRAVSNSQAYKGLGNGWTAEVIIHILNGVLKDVPRDEEIVVLSMYDGIGTGRYCLDKMGFTNVKYFAYEIDKYAKQVSMSNYPDIIQLGDAFDVRHPDWTVGY